MPNPLQGVWLEARCNRDAMPEDRVCDVCKFSNLMGVVDNEIPPWLNMWGNKHINEAIITDANKKIILTSHSIAHMFPDKIGLKKNKSMSINCEPFPYSFNECFKNVQETIVKREMPDKKKCSIKKKPIPLEFEAATIIKSQAACINVHYVESDMDVLEVSEVIYKRVKKEVIQVDKKEILCYNNDGVYYECGLNGEIKGIINID
jgi:hypothetical protein